MSEMMYWLWLTSISGVGSVKITRLLQIFGNPEAIWRAGPNQLRGIEGINKKDMEGLSQKSMSRVQNICRTMEKLNIRAISIDHPEYPERLKHIYDPPYIIYIKGELKPCDIASVAIVGSRNASIYGKNVAEKLAYQLAQQGLTVVSGMARGVDTFAHRGALKAGKRTIAVLGCGVDVVYPSENRELMHYIQKSGAVISEYLPGTPPDAKNFPARNRIISGMTLGTVVVEAGEKSGSLITADFALEQGREVFAVPGNIDQQSSKGTNKLVKQGAKLVTCIDDILEEIMQQIDYTNLSAAKISNIDYDNQKGKKSSTYYYLTEDEKRLIDLISSTPVHIDELCTKLGCDVQKVNAILMMLEVRGYIRQVYANQFVRSI